MRTENEAKVVNFLKAKDAQFLQACERVRIPPTRRQASKWLNKRGLAYKEGRR